MKHLLIVGKKFSGLTNKIVDLGYTYTLLQDELTTKFPDKKFARRVVADFSSNESLLATVAELHGKTPIDGVITVYENYILPTAVIAEHLQLPCLPVASAEACTDKYIMRSLFAQAPEKISPGFEEVKDEASLLQFAQDHQFPLILKPANLAKSLLVTKNDSLEELIANYRKSVELLQTTYKKYAPHRSPKLIVEEFLEGSIHSVDAFVDADGTPHVLDQVVDYQTGYDIGFQDNFHYSRVLPSILSNEDQTALRHCADVGIRALGMTSCPAHVEVIMTKAGPRIVEIGARNGGYRERMHRLANDIDILGNAVKLALNEPLDIQATRNDPVAVLELFPKNPGNFVQLVNEEALRGLASLQYLSLKPTVGQFVGKASDGYKMCAVVILHNENADQFKRDLDFIAQSVYVETTLEA